MKFDKGYFFENLVLIGIIGLVLFSLVSRCNESKAPILIDNVVHDTLIKVVESEPIYIEKKVDRIITRTDTIIQSFPFEIRLDTFNIGKIDSLQISYIFPEDYLRFDAKFKNDSIVYINTNHYIQSEKAWYEEWYINLITFFFGLAGGIYLGAK